MRFKIFRFPLARLALATLTFLPAAVFGAAGDLYVGNLESSIFRITPAGVTTQFATGFDPYGIAFNASAEAFSASSEGKKIVRIAADGTVSNFATGLGDPLGLAFDSAGNLYAADFTLGTIWRYAANASRTSFATGIVHADGIAFDPSGNLFVTSFTPGQVTRVARNGTKSIFATGLTGPVGVACDSGGNVFVAERDGGRISRFAPDGSKSTFSTEVASPYGLAFDAGGTLFVADQFSSTIYRMSATGGKTQFATIFGEAGFMSFEPAVGLLQNVSTRMRVLTGDNVLIGGFIVTGSAPKKVVVRAIGPSLAQAGVTNSLQDPVLELHDNTGAVLATNDDWKQSQQSELEAVSLAPFDDREAAIVTTLMPGAYTAIVTGKSATTGVGLVEVYGLADGSQSRLGNISTRGFVDTGDNVMIGGFIVGAGNGANVLVRALGPSLAQFGITNSLPDPTVALFNGNGAVIATNDNWADTQQSAIQATNLAPSDNAESAILTPLPPGGYTAIVSGKNATTGVGLVEIFSLP